MKNPTLAGAFVVLIVASQFFESLRQCSIHRIAVIPFHPVPTRSADGHAVPPAPE